MPSPSTSSFPRRDRIRRSLGALGVLTAAGACSAQTLTPEWTARFGTVAGRSDTPIAMRVSPSGEVYMAGEAGPSFNRDVLVVKFRADGSVAWSATYDGPAAWHDQARDLALTPDGDVVVVGSTPGPQQFSDMLLLRLDGATGALVWERVYHRGTQISDTALAVAIDGDGNIYAVGQTSGDGADALIVKFDSAGQALWVKSYDGPSSAPYSQDAYRMVRILPGGDVLAVGEANMNDLRTDYVTTRYRAEDGAVVWRSFFGGVGNDAPADVVLDEAGDIYITGLVLDQNNRIGTVKFRQADGSEVWSALDWVGLRDRGRAIALDGAGRVIIAGDSDPDGTQSNFNENIYAVARDAQTGALLWTFLYGDNCVGCYDIVADVAADGAGNVYIAGRTSSAPYVADGILFRLDRATGRRPRAASSKGPRPRASNPWPCCWTRPATRTWASALTTSIPATWTSASPGLPAACRARPTATDPRRCRS